MSDRKLEMAVEILTGGNIGACIQFWTDVSVQGMDGAVECITAEYLDSPYLPEFLKVVADRKS